ncbi:MAG: peptidoglycan DD-metalloendopeptidase family protein [Steroidobacteraceae bacterium]
MTICCCLPAPYSSAADRGQTEAQLRALGEQIEKVRQQVGRDSIERDRLSRDLRSAEVTVAQARGELDRLRRERVTRATSRAELGQRRKRQQEALDTTRAGLAAQIRAAYRIGREEPLKLLLNQQDPARAGRMFAYFGYFGRLRATQIASIEGQVREIDALDAKLVAQDEALAALEKQQSGELAKLDVARRDRGKALASLQHESRNRSQNLERMRRQQAGLEKLLKDLKRTLDKYPIDANDAFAKVRGRLAWPVDGKLSARFGQTRAGGVKWNGVMVATERGNPVRAVYGGRVVYADWLPGLGLLIIVDHGDGYLSLYGHNERLFKGIGEQVRVGEQLASAGDSGGRSRPELYFEIRRAGKPVDPLPWFKAQAP